MTQKGFWSGAVSAAAAIVLSLGALGLAQLSTRDLPALQVAAARAVAEPDEILGLAEPGTLAAAYCFDPLRPPSLEVMAWINEEMGRYEEFDYQLGGGSWSGSAGTPPSGILTWSFVPDGTSVPGLSGQSNAASTLFASMDAKFGNNRALWISKFQQVFDRWGAISGVRYQRVTNNGMEWDDGAPFPNSGGSNTPGSTRGHIRISMRALDGNGGVLAFNYFPTTGDMVIDSAENWHSSSGDYRFLRNTVAHEHGHGLGIAHVCPINNNKLMEPFLSTSFDGPQHDDIRASHARYGDFYEPNGTAGTASDLGTVAMGATVTPSVLSPGVTNGTVTSIDRLADVDWFKFTTTQGALINVTLSPRGHTYLDGPQNTNGSCSSGTSRNTLIAADLTLAVYSNSGNTVLQSVNATGAGSNETITGLLLPEAGTYYIRVGATSSNQPQLYDVRFTLTAASACPQFTDQPQSQDICAGQMIILYANAIGSPSPTFQWYRDQQLLPGETETSLVIFPANSGHAGTYTCIATNSCGSESSDPAVVTVTSQVSITSHPQPVTAPVGGIAHFSVGVSGGGTMEYQWLKDGLELNGETSDTLEINPVTLADAGQYTCRVGNGVCSPVMSNSALLTIGTSCYANCDGSTTPPVLNVADFSCFLARFAAGDPYANCNVADFTCFLTAFAQGCP
jgi:hypothetical protein